MSFQFQLGEGGERERERETEKEDVDDDGGCGGDDDKERDKEGEMIVIMMIMMIIIMMVMYSFIAPLRFLTREIRVAFPGKPAATEWRYPTYCACWVFQCFKNLPMDYRAYAIFLHAYTYTHILGRHIVCTEFWFRENLPTVDAQSLARNGYPSMW